MGRKFESPVERWPGHIVVSDPMLLPQSIAWRVALREAQALDDNASTEEWSQILLPAAWLCLDEWEIEGVPQDITKIEATPTDEFHEFTRWLMKCVQKPFQDTGDEAVPNE